MRRVVCLMGWAALVAACGEEPQAPPAYPFTFSAHADGQPLEGVRIFVANQEMPSPTNEEGQLTLPLTGPDGTRLEIRADCPEGHRDPVPQTHTLRHVVSLDPTAQQRGIQVTFECPPEHRSAVVVIRTNDLAAGLPVMVDGTERTRTDASGAAHVHMEVTPEMTFQVLIATASINPRLQPRDPSMSFTVPDRDEVFIFNQDFEEEQVRRPRHRPRPRPTAPVVRLPIRIGGGR